jgi:DNA-binding response OmpR family regulator
MMTARILVVEDEADLCSGLCDLLSLEGYQVSGVGSIAAYEAWVRDHGYDILLLDRTLPDGEGLDILHTHRLSHDTPVIIMSGKGAPEDRIAGLEADADYYLVKPVESAELIALVRRFARRLVVPEAEVYRLDAQRWKLHMPDEGVVPLTRNEMSLMSCFVEQPGETLSRDEIIRALGGRPDVYDERRLEVLVRRFRKKITEAGYDNFPLSTVYGSGYAFNERLEML